jgi:lipid-A-disaccharide synthase
MIFSFTEFQTLLYPLGFISGIFFTLRCLVQWVESERKGVSDASPTFWHLSWLGNLFLTIHAFIQLQFILYILQVGQTLLSLRNVNLLSPSPMPRRSFEYLLMLGLTLAILFFTLHLLWIPKEAFTFFGVPKIFETRATVPPSIHFLGSIGLIAYSIRFWIQWLEAEEKKTSLLSKRFFHISLAGGLGSGLYFAYLLDPVNCIGPLCSLLPSLRNLKLQKMAPSEKFDIVLIAGETSGDLLGAGIIKSLKKNYSFLTIGGGIAGVSMREQGIVSWTSAEHLSVMGIVDVLKKIPSILLCLHSTVNNILKAAPQAVICIDQPSFSLALAKRLRKKGYSGKIIQVVAPSVWAYKPQRAQQFANYFDLLLPLYHFEVPYFSNLMKTVWVGHPIIDNLPKVIDAPKSPTLALFPGSRKGEICRNLPLQLAASKLVQKKHPFVSIAICSGRGHEALTRKITQKYSPNNVVIIPFEDRYSLMKQATSALAKAGTITLELALYEIPTACCYQTGHLTQLYARYCLRLKKQFFALPNILAQRQIIPEFILPPIDPKKMADALSNSFETSNRPSYKEAILPQIDPKESPYDLIAKEITCLIM